MLVGDGSGATPFAALRSNPVVDGLGAESNGSGVANTIGARAAKNNEDAGSQSERSNQKEDREDGRRVSERHW